VSPKVKTGIIIAVISVIVATIVTIVSSKRDAA
jgi:hypothetical protein